MTVDPTGFQLHITFSGLCLVVSDLRGTAPMAHVLLLDPTKRPTGSGGSMEKHIAKVFYDQAYADRRATDLAGTYDGVALHGLLDLPGSVARPPQRDGFPTLLPDALVDLDQITGRHLPTTCIGSDFDHEVAARICIRYGAVSDFSVSGPWRFGSSTDRYMVWKLGWLIPCPGMDHLDLPDGAGIRPLHPIHGSVELRVKNVIAAECIPDDPPLTLPSPTGMNHFAAYYDLYPDHGHVDVPQYGRTLPAGQHAYGSLITCTMARACV